MTTRTMTMLAMAGLTGTLLLASGTAASAAIISKTYSTPLVVDGATASPSVAITAADLAPGSVIDYLTISIDFIKCDGPLSADQTSCSGSRFSFNRAIVFKLTSPDGTTVNLVNDFTYDGQTPGARAQVLFDDAAGTIVGGDTLQSGTFRPVGSLADFIGENALGTYTLLVEDKGRGDPLGLLSFTLNVRSDPLQAVPEPASLALLGAGLLGLGIARRRRAR